MFIPPHIKDAKARAPATATGKLHAVLAPLPFMRKVDVQLGGAEPNPIPDLHEQPSCALHAPSVEKLTLHEAHSVANPW